jgi:hypothetical protein
VRSRTPIYYQAGILASPAAILIQSGAYHRQLVAVLSSGRQEKRRNNNKNVVFMLFLPAMGWQSPPMHGRFIFIMKSEFFALHKKVLTRIRAFFLRKNK